MIFTKLDKNEKNNKQFLNVINTYLVKKDLSSVKQLLSSITDFTNDAYFLSQHRTNFLTSGYCVEMFGIAEDIVNTMKNMVFSGNVKVNIEQKNVVKMLEQLTYKQEFYNVLKEAYKQAVTSVDAKSYVLIMSNEVFDEMTNEKLREDFKNFIVLKSYEVEEDGNNYSWVFYKDKDYIDDKGLVENKPHKFVYQFNVINKDLTELTIKGYLPNKAEMEAQDILETLNIDTLTRTFSYKPIIKLDIVDTLLPNILPIESALAEALYFQREDLPNSQTQTYTPENFLYHATDSKSNYSEGYKDKYKTKHTVRGGGLDAQKIEVVEGASAIATIERNIALNVLRATLDAKISPVSLGYNLVDRLGTNTDVGEAKERVSIRLRENHVEIVKLFTATLTSTYLYVHGKDVPEEKITVIFDPYITPSTETMTNVLAKQVQFGIKSRKQAIKDLNKDELSDEEIEEEVNEVLKASTQVDYNVKQQLDNEKDNNLKVNNVLKSSGIEE
jgi:hypothetical protein